MNIEKKYNNTNKKFKKNNTRDHNKNNYLNSNVKK